MNAPENSTPARSYRTVARIFVLCMVAVHGFFLWAVRDRIARGDPDFTVFYTAATLLRQGQAAHLYEGGTQWAVQRDFAQADQRRGPLPFIHPPFEALIFIPFTYFSYPVAFALWNLLNLVLLSAVFWVLKPVLASLRPFAWWELLAASLAFFPVFANFHQGQDAILLLLLLVLAYRALSRKVYFLAGAWLGLGLFKYHLILPLVLLLAFWKGRKLVFGFAMTSFLVALLSLAIVGWHGVLQYPAFAWNVVTRAGLGGIPPRQLPDIAGLLTGWPGVVPTAWPMQVAVGAFTISLLIVVILLHKPTSGSERPDLYISCAVVAALLVGYSTNTYDLTLLILPIVLVTDYCGRNLHDDKPARTRLLLPLVPLLISPLWFFLWLRWQRINLIAIFLLWWVFAIRHELTTAGAQRSASLVGVENE